MLPRSAPAAEAVARVRCHGRVCARLSPSAWPSGSWRQVAPTPLKHPERKPGVCWVTAADFGSHQPSSWGGSVGSTCKYVRKGGTFGGSRCDSGSSVLSPPSQTFQAQQAGAALWGAPWGPVSQDFFPAPQPQEAPLEMPQIRV